VTRVGAVVMAALLLLYLVFAGWYATILLRVGEPVATAMGVALLVLPVLGAWALVVELRFGIRSERLARRLEAEGGLPDEVLPARASGRVDRDAARDVFPRYQAEVEADADSWRAWFRLALAYDASGDRRRARWATRRAIALASAERRAAG
jgi:hypothetical protein